MGHLRGSGLTATASGKDETMYINYVNYNGGINNLCTVFDNMGRCASSTKGKEQAIKNFKRKYKEIKQ